MPRGLNQTSSFLTDQHIKVKLHVIAQQLLGQVDHLVVYHRLLHRHVQVQGGPHDLTNILLVLVVSLYMTAQVVSMPASIHSTSHNVIVETDIGPQFLLS